MKNLKIYRIDAVFMDNYSVTAVSACENPDKALELSGFDKDGYSNQTVTYLGNYVYNNSILICRESV